MKVLQKMAHGRMTAWGCLALTSLLLATGCKTYQQQNKVIQPWRRGNLTNAVTEAKALADKNANGKDAIVWQLEEGAVLRAVGDYRESNEAFGKAQQKIDDYELKAKVRLGQETGAMFSNQANLAYEGRSYDGIMLNTYRALNYLALGEIDDARPELIRAYQRQQDAVEANKKRIADAQEAVEDNKDSKQIEQSQNSDQLQSQLVCLTTNIDTMHVYADYVNPFTVYLDGLYFLAQATDDSDLERARKSLERTASFVPQNQFVQQDLALSGEVMDGKPIPPLTYVLFETGCAPERGQIRIDIPIFVARLSYIGAAFPTLEFQGNYCPSLTVEASGAHCETELLASMDSVVALDYKNELPVVIAKTVASTVIKATASYAANTAANQSGGDIGGLISQLGTAIYQAAVNIADERTWTTLPKEFLVARLPTPEDRKLELVAPNGIRVPVQIGEGTMNVVYVKSITSQTPLLVSQFKLK